MDRKFQKRFNEVQFVIQSKCEELRYLNYDSISVKTIWEYCVKKKWRKKDIDQIPIHQMVSDIFSLSASDVISYIQISEQMKVQDGFMSLEPEEMEMLLSKKVWNGIEIGLENNESI